MELTVQDIRLNTFLRSNMVPDLATLPFIEAWLTFEYMPVATVGESQDNITNPHAVTPEQIALSWRRTFGLMIFLREYVKKYGRTLKLDGIFDRFEPGHFLPQLSYVSGFDIGMKFTKTKNKEPGQTSKITVQSYEEQRFAAFNPVSDHPMTAQETTNLRLQLPNDYNHFTLPIDIAYDDDLNALTLEDNGWGGDELKVETLKIDMVLAFTILGKSFPFEKSATDPSIEES